MKKEWDWKKYPEIKPIASGIYVVLSHKPSRYLELDEDLRRQRKRMLKQNDEHIMEWALWKYTEECINIDEEFVTYKKNWDFFGIESGQVLLHVTHFIELPNLNIPKAKENGK